MEEEAMAEVATEEAIEAMAETVEVIKTEVAMQIVRTTVSFLRTQ